MLAVSATVEWITLVYIFKVGNLKNCIVSYSHTPLATTMNTSTERTIYGTDTLSCKVFHAVSILYFFRTFFENKPSIELILNLLVYYCNSFFFLENQDMHSPEIIDNNCSLHIKNIKACYHYMLLLRASTYTTNK